MCFAITLCSIVTHVPRARFQRKMFKKPRSTCNSSRRHQRQRSSATAPLETAGKRRIFKEADPAVSVLQAPLEDFADFPMAGEQRRTPIRRQRRLAGLATGFVFGVVAAAGVGAIVYSQSHRDYLLQTAARIWDETNWRETVKTGAAVLGALLADSSKELKDAQPMASEKPPLSTQQPEGSSLEANATPSLDASDTVHLNPPMFPIELKRNCP